MILNTLIEVIRQFNRKGWSLAPGNFSLSQKKHAGRRAIIHYDEPGGSR